ncbi:AAA family ATPase [Dongshaea marina]|uniref:AAA family ATPase n=1 Tax=Dongshaea marina TaxID=2047966 RepID=UPI000D3E49C5|nr:hypothetical protein [Dongshaea marina]
MKSHDVQNVIFELEGRERSESFLNSISQSYSSDTNIIVIGSINEISFLLDLESKGINYIFFPKNISRIIEIINGNPKRDGVKRTAKRINVIGAKGGVGCSLVSSQLALCLSEVKNREVLYINYHNGKGCHDILFGNKDIKSIDSLRDISLDKIDSNFIKPFIQEITSKLKFVNLRFPLEKLAYLFPVNDRVTDCLSNDTSFVVSDISGANTLNLNSEWISNNSDVILYVSDSSFSSLRELSVLVNSNNNDVRTLIVIVQKQKSNLLALKNYIEKTLSISVDLVIPYEEKIDDVLIDKQLPYKSGSKVGDAIFDMTNSVIGSSQSEAARKYFRGGLSDIVKSLFAK